jgi:hypothetical protein
MKALVMIAGLWGCTSSSTTHVDGATTTAGHTLTWDVDGTHYIGGPQSGASTIQGVIVVSGQDSNAHAVMFSVMATAPGTYDLTHYPGTSFNWSDHTNSWTISTTGGGTGMVVITKLTATEVAGTFVANPVPTGSATGMPAVTNGAFDLAL